MSQFNINASSNNNNVLTIKEFCNDKLEIFDNDIINKLQEIINQNYEAVYIKKNINNVEF